MPNLFAIYLGLPEVCLHEKTGVLVPPSAPKEVAEAVLRLASDANLRQQYGEAARSLVDEKFTLQHTLDQMDTLFTAVSAL